MQAIQQGMTATGFNGAGFENGQQALPAEGLQNGRLITVTSPDQRASVAKGACRIISKEDRENLEFYKKGINHFCMVLGEYDDDEHSTYHQKPREYYSKQLEFYYNKTWALEDKLGL
ncbi:hypothetical protein [Parendozoicomonas haliclonae]|uniref:Uncharacterized protein n=1 Tax=Parendozoicomonas haliclonae TaxID=1960125 RepID=A0A1X7AER5_9GAMM|nr:hypothetical protein [Parendozoicomonas haliclonae]SMA35323.1 hypothetical protein EHSB41UT_00518 [Parendozoicomonas haliclonae]